ncbi:MAG TPA: hypothetical protein VMZ66_04185 [Aeromicrobium sp.]|nr:hypothetical protein [Aeromicrobium sp.]
MDAGEMWRQRWHEISVRAEERKDSPSAIPALYAAYRTIGERDRAIVDAVIAEAVESDDATERFDALALVGEFRITVAVPYLQRLAERLKALDSPGAPWEREKVTRILQQLGTS